MGCFYDYQETVVRQDYLDVAGHLDAAATLAACLHHQIFGSGPLYHPVGKAKFFTKSESDTAQQLAKKVNDVMRPKDNNLSANDMALLADEAYEFAIKCLVARGAVHKGPPKIPNE
jgi:hypothetical protein